MRTGLGMAVVLLCAALAAPVAAAPPRDENERLRADMEGQAERLRLTVETFMQQENRRVGETLAAQQQRIDRLQTAVLTLAALSGGLTLAVVMLLGRTLRGDRPSPSET